MVWSIYKLRHKDDLKETNIYIGSTNNIKQREHEHRSSCNNVDGREYNQEKYKYIRDNGGWQEWEILEIEKCDSKEEAISAEDYFYDLLKPTLNTLRPYRSPEEDKQLRKDKCMRWARENRERYRELNNKSREKNKHKYNAKSSARVTCECGLESTHGHLSRHRKTQRHIDLMNKK